MQNIIFVTGNPMKVLHANTALSGTGFMVEGKKLSIIEPREEDPEKVVAEKAMQAFGILNCPLMVEDSGIFIEALNGFPKTFVHFALNTLGTKNILKLMNGIQNRKVEFRQALAYMEPDMTEPKIFSYVDGGFTLADKIWEGGGRGVGEFDKILIPPGENKPLSLFSDKWRAERDAIQNKGKIHYEQLAHWLKSGH